jgi:Mg-chelatase subunit ChlD
MNPDAPRDAREELEIRITAMLMGQLSPEESVELEAQIATDPELRALHSRLRRAAELLRESRAFRETAASASTTPLRLSQARREQLLATFRGIKPVPSPAAKPALPLRRQWRPRLVLAASIAVLLGGSVIYLVGPMHRAPEEKGYAQMRSSSADLQNAPSLPEPLAANSAPSQHAFYDFAPTGRETVGLGQNAKERAMGWRSQPGAIRLPEVQVQADPEKALKALKQLEPAIVDSAEASPLASAAGQGLPAMQPELATSPTAAPVPKMAGVYLPSTEVAPPSTPEALTFDFKGGKELAEQNRVSDFGAIRGEATLGYGVELSKAERDGAGRQIEDSVSKRGPSDWFFVAPNGPAEGMAKAPADPTDGVKLKVLQDDVRQSERDHLQDVPAIAGVPAPVELGISSLAKDSRDGAAAQAGTKAMFSDAKEYRELGRLEMASRKYDEILEKDPNNIAARKGREEVSALKAATAEAGYSAARSQAMSEVTSLWERPYRRFDRAGGEKRGTSSSSDAEGIPGLNEALAESQKPQNVSAAGENTYWDTPDALAATKGVNLGDAAKNGSPSPPESLSGGLAITKLDGDFDRGMSRHVDGAFINRPDEGNIRSLELAPRYYTPGGKAPGKPSATSGAEPQQRRGNRPELETVAPESKAKSGVEPAQERFVNAFIAARKAEELTTKGEPQKALEVYREAETALDQVKQQWPKWQPELLEFRLKRTKEAIGKLQQEVEAAAKKVAEEAKPAPAAEAPAPAKAPEPPPVPQPEVSTKDNAFSTFSLNVSDVSFQLASASLDKAAMPEPAAIRSEEFINAFNYRDPEPAPGAPFAFAAERARYPFAHNRDLLRISLKTAASGREAGRPLNLVLLIDNSGSMERADRVRTLKEALRVLAHELKPQDKLSLITFARAPRLWADGVSGDKAVEATQRAGEITPQGGTDLSAAIDLGYQTALKHYSAGNVNRVVLLTDGAANLGEVKAEALKETVEKHRVQGVAFDCFGVGWEGYNDDLLEQLSRNGDGRYGFINTPEAAATEFAGQLAGALRVAASDVKVQVEFNPKRVRAYRQVGYAKHQLKKEQFRDNTVDAAEIGAAEAGNALYVIDVDPRGEGDVGIARARFKVPGTAEYREHEWTIPFQAPAPAMEQASSSLRLAATAAAFSEWLAQSPYAAEVSTDRLLALINGIPPIYGADPRPAKLESMIRQAKSISGR